MEKHGNVEPLPPAIVYESGSECCNTDWSEQSSAIGLDIDGSFSSIRSNGSPVFDRLKEQTCDMTCHHDNIEECYDDDLVYDGLNVTDMPPPMVIMHEKSCEHDEGEMY